MGISLGGEDVKPLGLAAKKDGKPILPEFEESINNELGSPSAPQLVEPVGFSEVRTFAHVVAGANVRLGLYLSEEIPKVVRLAVVGLPIFGDPCCDVQSVMKKVLRASFTFPDPSPKVRQSKPKRPTVEGILASQIKETESFIQRQELRWNWVGVRLKERVARS